MKRGTGQGTGTAGTGMWWCLVLAGVSSGEQQQGWPGGMAVIAPCLPTAVLGKFQKESLLVGKEASARSSIVFCRHQAADLWGGLCVCCLLRA